MAESNKKNNQIDPSGLVKGWAVQKASRMLRNKGVNNFYIDAGGDIQVSGKNKSNNNWTIGIKNPFDQKKNVIKILKLKKNFPFGIKIIKNGISFVG